MFRLKDLQGAGLKEDHDFKSIKEIVKNLTAYHDQDFKGTDAQDNELSLPAYFKYWKIKSINARLSWLQQYGMWEVVKIKKGAKACK